MIAINSTIKSVTETLNQYDNTVIFGGFIRDSLMKLTPKDVDIATNVEINTIIKLFPYAKERITSSGVTVLTLNRNGIDFEIVSHRDELVEKIRKSDLTINGLYYQNNEIKDSTTLGIPDLKAKNIRCSNVSLYEQKIADSPQVWLKPFRILSADEDWLIESTTLEILKKYSQAILKISPTILNAEAYRILNFNNPINSLKFLSYTGIIPSFDEASLPVQYTNFNKQKNYHFLLVIIAISIGKEPVSQFINTFHFPTLIKTKFEHLYQHYIQNELPNDFLLKNEFMFLQHFFNEKK